MQHQSLRKTWNAPISGIILVPQFRFAVSMTVGGWYTFGSNVQLLSKTHYANQFLEILALRAIQCVGAFYRKWAMVDIDPHIGITTKTKENKDVGSYECHPSVILKTPSRVRKDIESSKLHAG
jgi:hypothetical protein